MSNTRRTHPGLFGVTIALAIPWYLCLGIGFMLSVGTLSGQSKTYALISAYVPLQAWGVVYFVLGFTLAIAVLVPCVPHRVVRVCCATGLMLTSFWVAIFFIALFTDRLDLISVLPAWLTVGLVEYNALREPAGGTRNELPNTRGAP